MRVFKSLAIVAAGVLASGLAFAGVAASSSAVSAHSGCKPVVFRVYFDADAATVPNEAQDTIALAWRDVAACGEIDAGFAADPRRISNAGDRHVAAARSVAILDVLRDRGFDGEVKVTSVSEVVVAAEKNVGPDYLEVTLSPRPREVVADASR